MKNETTCTSYDFGGVSIVIEEIVSVNHRSVVTQKQVAGVMVAGEMLTWDTLPVGLRKKILEAMAS